MIQMNKTTSHVTTAFTSALVAFATVTGAAGAPTAFADNVELRLATLAPPGSKWMEELEKAAASIDQDTEGRVKMRYYPGGEQGDEKDFVRKIKAGQLDGAAVTAVGLSMIDESIRVLELPRMFTSQDELDYVADKMWGYFQKKFEKKGFKLNDRGEVGPIYFLSQSKIDSVATLKKTKMWKWGDDTIVGAMFKQLGVDNVPLGVPEVDSALTAGRINACYSSPIAAVALQWYSKVKFMTSMPMSYAIGATVVAIESLKKIGDADQKTVAKIAKAAGKKLRTAIRKENINAQKTMTRKGVTLVTTPPEMVAEFETASQTVWKNLVGKVYSQKELDMVTKYRDEYRAKNATK